jgi:hypothetical protein
MCLVSSAKIIFHSTHPSRHCSTVALPRQILKSSQTQKSSLLFAPHLLLWFLQSYKALLGFAKLISLVIGSLYETNGWSKCRIQRRPFRHVAGFCNCTSSQWCLQVYLYDVRVNVRVRVSVRVRVRGRVRVRVLVRVHSVRVHYNIITTFVLGFRL